MQQFMERIRPAALRASAIVAAVAVGVAAGVGAASLQRAVRAQPVAASSSTTHGWGLSFQVEGEPPVPELSAEQLAPYNAYYYNTNGEKRLYLTFDAGYENGNTAPILDALKKHGAPGAFFVVKPYIKGNPDLILRMVAEGHIVGNHTNHHPDMSRKSRSEFVQELADVEAAYLALTGKPMQRFYRPPEGKFSEENLAWAKSLGYKTMFWGLAYVDWDPDAQPTREKAFDKLLPRTFPGVIVLLHATSATNAAVLDELLTRWESMGYTFGSLTELGAPQAGQSAPQVGESAPQAGQSTPQVGENTPQSGQSNSQPQTEPGTAQTQPPQSAPPQITDQLGTTPGEPPQLAQSAAQMQSAERQATAAQQTAQLAAQGRLQQADGVRAEGGA